MHEFFKYGEKVDGYEIRVINEREARAGAGILFVLGILSLLNATMLGHLLVTKYFISFFTLDFLMRVINPNYSMSLLLGRIFVQNQVPEYVGATQKRFAWAIGLALAIPMFYLLVINVQPNPIKILICMICLLLLLMESAFSICLGCKIFNLVMPKPATHCPAGVCEIRKKDKIQTFNTIQKAIVAISLVLLFTGIYFYLYKLENNSFFGKRVTMMMLSPEKKQAIKDAKLAQAYQDFDNDDDF